MPYDVGDLSRGVSVFHADPAFDLTGDGMVDRSDVDQWLANAAAENGFASAYLAGDTNLDCIVDAQDLNNLAADWKQTVASWSR